MELVLNYGPVQAVDVSQLGEADQARLVPGQWAQLKVSRSGDGGLVAQQVDFVGPCLEQRDDRDGHSGGLRRCSPGTIHGTGNADSVVTKALTPLAAPQFGVSEKEFSFTPSVAIVQQGQSVQITVTNSGTIQHNFKVELPDQDVDQTLFATNINPGETRTATFTFPKGGEWQMYCPIANHEDLGMKGTIAVLGPALTMPVPGTASGGSS